jgi:O-antigen/teichoic acid export membrane protein
MSERGNLMTTRRLFHRLAALSAHQRRMYITCGVLALILALILLVEPYFAAPPNNTYWPWAIGAAVSLAVGVWSFVRAAKSQRGNPTNGL